MSALADRTNELISLVAQQEAALEQVRQIQQQLDAKYEEVRLQIEAVRPAPAQ
jgi:hypothetical protein